METTLSKTAYARGEELFCVREGIPVAVALNEASALLSVAIKTALDNSGEGGWAACRLTEMAKALVDSALGPIEFPDRVKTAA